MNSLRKFALEQNLRKYSTHEDRVAYLLLQLTDNEISNDDFPEAMVTLLELTSQEGWSEGHADANEMNAWA